MDHQLCQDGFPLTALRETNVLLSLRHPHVVRVREMVVGRTLDKVFMVMDLLHCDVRTLMKRLPEPFSPAEVRHRARMPAQPCAAHVVAAGRGAG